MEDDDESPDEMEDNKEEEWQFETKNELTVSPIYGRWMLVYLLLLGSNFLIFVFFTLF